MTRVFVYEYCTAVGLGRAASDPAHSLFREGAAMRDAVAADFARAGGFAVLTLDGDDASAEGERFRERVGAADAVVVIAPEFSGLLAERCAWVRAAGRLCLNPSAAALELTADKLALARHWHAAGVPTPRTWPVGNAPLASHPVVWKPRYGAGSTATMLLRRPDDEPRFFERFPPADVPAACLEHLIAQEYVGGRAASVAFLIGPRETVPLVPAFQHVSADDRFTYEGGELPIPSAFAERVVALGTRAVGCVSGLLGYVGVDVVLGEAADGADDFAIEINPRLTTSYVGLRALADFNLATAMDRVAAGEPLPLLHWRQGRVAYRPNGEVIRRL